MAFQVSVQPSGRSFQVEPGETLLNAGIRQGIGMPYGCKDGACGSCKCLKLSGEVSLSPYQAKALSEQELAQGWVLTCRAQALSDVVLESKQVTSAGAHPIKKMPVRVAAMKQLSHDVMQITLQLPSTETMAYHAGQYVEFLLRDGSRRAYSIANAPHTLVAGAPQIELHLRHMPGGKFTDHVFGAMKEKEIQRIEGPQGSFYLREDSNKPIVLLASGTGFAPIKAILEHMQNKGITRPTRLYWGGRRPGDLYLNDWVQAQLATMPNLRYVPVVSDALPQDAWTGRTGFVHQAVLQDTPDMRGYEVYACGAPIVVDSARADYTQAGLANDDFYADAFTSAADKA